MAFRFDDRGLVQASECTVEALRGAGTRRVVVLRPKEVGQQPQHRVIVRRLRMTGPHTGEFFEFVGG
jgi:hypothetical protein